MGRRLRRAVLAAGLLAWAGPAWANPGPATNAGALIHAGLLTLICLSWLVGRARPMTLLGLIGIQTS